MSADTLQYAEVILPLPLQGPFTYRIPLNFSGRVKPGCRVVVPFGKKKFYTAIVVGLSTKGPEGFEVKEIVDVPDDGPILRHPQMRLWEWIAEYYLCTIGDVYKAAVPAGLKIESETFVELNPDFEESVDSRLSEREAIIVQALDHGGKMTPVEIEKRTGLQRVATLLLSMVGRGMVIVSEKLVERYRSKKETCVRLVSPRTDNEAMRKAFDAVAGAPKQEKMLVTLLDMVNKNIHEGMPPVVTRNALLEATGLSAAILSALATKGIVTTFVREVNRFKSSEAPTGELPVLSDAQSAALKEIHAGFTEKDIILLHGVTSSGKTELYIHLIDFVMRRGDQVLYLVPEIALTTQLTRRLQRVFGDKVVIYHSKFSDNERVDIWRRVLNGSGPCVIIGARSSVFLPFAKLGLVIVDEEHESSYKQHDPAPRYNARDCAMVLASMHGARTLLGSATPSVETYYKAETGRYGLVTLGERYSGVKLPRIEVIDMAAERKRKNVAGPFSQPLLEMSREALRQGGQAIFFLNRRGFAPVVECRRCAYVPKCRNCDVSLTYHRRAGEMVCHYCGATYPLPSLCPSCGEPSIEVKGYGTERIEDSVEKLFPEAKISRLDLDTTRNKDGYDNIIDDFSSGKSQILVGTQMVTKGLDFDRVNVVGVINADTMINFPDFRASERAFNMLEQVAGRAGRRSAQGLVAVQTSQPAHPVISYLQAHNYMGFYRHELDERRRFNYPPYTRVIDIYLKHRDPRLLDDAAMRYADALRQLFGNRVFGPDEPHVARVQLLYIRKIMLKVETQASMRKVKEILRSVYERFMENTELRSLQIYYDVDPS